MRLNCHRPHRSSCTMASTHAISRKSTILLFSFLIFVATANANEEADALMRLKVSFNNAGVLQSWEPGSEPCNENRPWEGVRCIDGQVYFIRLEGLNLSNQIDIDALMQLPMLRTVSFTGNTFSGRIPAFNRLVALKALYLSDNKFSGEIPGDYFKDMKYLKKLWLSSNRFSGPIPSSLDEIPLMELHLENNTFSGSIPELNMESVSDLNLANNNLTGYIPTGLLRFDEKTFEENPGLCGEKTRRACDARYIPPPKENETNDGQDSYKIVSLGVMIASAIILVCMIAGILFLWRRQIKEDKLPKDNVDVVDDELGRSMEKERVSDMNQSGRMMTAEKENVNGVSDMNQSGAMMTAEKKNVPNVVPETNGSARMVAVAKDPRGSRGVSMEVPDLTLVNNEKCKFGLSDLMKASAEVLGNGTMGSSYKAIISNRLTLVVKRIKETNTIDRDAFDGQIRRLGGIKHKNVLAPLAYHYRAEEKLLINEYMAQGSLMYLLHGDRGSNTELKWPTRLKIIQGIARGLFYLHTELSQLELPHGDLKSSNVLLSPEYEPLLSDYGFCSLITRTQASQSLFAYKSPEALQNRQVSPKCDVYCMGIIILELLTGKYPSQYLSNGNGGTDVVQWARSAISEGREVELFDKDITSPARFLPEIKEILHIGVACTEQEPGKRLDIREAISRIEAFHSISLPDESSRLTQSTSFGLL